MTGHADIPSEPKQGLPSDGSATADTSPFRTPQPDGSHGQPRSGRGDVVRNIMLTVAYDGTHFHGWQRQLDGIRTVQGEMEQVISRVVRHSVTLHGAGRTDAGVHAIGQTANFATDTIIPLDNLVRAVNSRLGDDVVIREARIVDDDFQASMSAAGKHYRYRICGAARRPVFTRGYVFHYWTQLDVASMADAAVHLVGTHDFASFAAAGDERDNTVRTIYQCCVSSCGDEICIDVVGNGFLYNMVRIIAGTLIHAGRGRFVPDQVAEIRDARDRTRAGQTAPAHGLCMMRVFYDKDELLTYDPHDAPDMLQL